MKIQYASDLHLELRDNWNYLKSKPLEVSGDVLILAGDTGYLGDENFSVHPFWDWISERYKQVFVVLGNHEFYKNYDLSSLTDGTVGEIRRNVHYYYNNVVDLGDGVELILSTLWAHIEKDNYRITERCISDFRRIMFGERTLDSQNFNNEHEKCLSFIKSSLESSKAKHKIVVTHHVPSFDLLAREFYGSDLNGAFVSDLNEFIKNSGAEYWIYGHSHRNINRTIGNTRCICNQLGYVQYAEHYDFKHDAIIEF